MLFTSITAIFAVLIVTNAEPTPNSKGNVVTIFYLRVAVHCDVYIVLMRRIDLGGPSRSIFSNRWPGAPNFLRSWVFHFSTMTFAIIENLFCTDF